MVQNLENAHFNMLEQQVRPSDVLDPRVLEALKNIERHQFVDESLGGLAYSDTNLPIGFGQVILSPVLQGRLLQALDVKADEDVLEIGTGTGYSSALLAQLASQVTTVDIVPELVEIAQNNLKKTGINNVTCNVGDASKGWPLSDRVQVIIITAAFETVPDTYLQNLAVGGRMLAIVGKDTDMSVQIIKRTTERKWLVDSVFETSVPAMMNAELKPEFEF